MSSAIQMPSTTRVHVSNSSSDNLLSALATHESRHGARHSMSYVEDLPAYNEDVSAPEYEEVDTSEPITLAMYLFKFGFVFPLFWALGAIILYSPLRAPPATPTEDGLSSVWLPEKAEDEREAILLRIRNTEVKWAKRCLWSLALFFIAIFIGFVVWGVNRG